MAANGVAKIPHPPRFRVRIHFVAFFLSVCFPIIFVLLQRQACQALLSWRAPSPWPTDPAPPSYGRRPAGQPPPAPRTCSGSPPFDSNQLSHFFQNITPPAHDAVSISSFRSRTPLNPSWTKYSTRRDVGCGITERCSSELDVLEF